MMKPIFKISKETSARIRAGLYIGIAVQAFLIFGMVLTGPGQSRDSSAPYGWEAISGPPVGVLTPFMFPSGAVDLEGSIRNAKRITLTEKAAFDRVSRIHEIISDHPTGFTVEQEERLAGRIYQESLQYGYDPELIVSLIFTESSFYQWARSHKGAIGLMQLLPMTGMEMAGMNQIPWGSAEILYDPDLNIKLGTQYLALLHQRFGDLEVALVAYNHGPTRVSKMMYRGRNLPTGYADKVIGGYRRLLTRPAPTGSESFPQALQTAFSPSS